MFHFKLFRMMYYLKNVVVTTIRLYNIVEFGVNPLYQDIHIFFLVKEEQYEKIHVRAIPTNEKTVLLSASTIKLCRKRKWLKNEAILQN